VTVRWGFIGAGYVASRAMAPAVHATPNASLYAVASRDQERSATLEPQVVHRSYQDLINDPMVDAVYISLTNAQHKEWVLAALNAGKHVLCEKPLAMNASEVGTLLDAATRNNRLLVEAVWTRWQPRMQRMAQIVKSGELGEVTGISSAFTFQGDLTNNYRLDPSLGGGALLDVGVYQAHLWLMLLNEDVSFSIESVERTMGDTGVDLTTRAQLQLNNSVTAHLVSSFDLPPQQHIEVTGTTATMRTGEGEAFTLWKQPSTLLIGETAEHFEADDAFALMVHGVSVAIEAGKPTIFPAASSLRAAEITDAISRFKN
jgi:D-xylose 1-dehydrogenase (NADP+, D-xylono-1,5-lactone-forming)